MGFRVEFKGYVQEVKSFSWGTVAVVTNANRVKNEAGIYETVSKDYVDVVLPDGVSVQENDFVSVLGSLTAAGYIKKDGTAGFSYKVKAWELTPAGDQVPSKPPVRSQVIQERYAPVTEDAPF